MNPGITEEVGMTARNFMDILRQHPLALSLVVMNFLLVAYVFYSGTVIIEQRKHMAELIINWQRESDKLMSQCVSTEVTKIVLDSLNKMTDTLLAARQRIDLSPMQIPMPTQKPEEIK